MANIREVNVEEITDIVAEMCKEANYRLSEDIDGKIRERAEQEEGIAKDILNDMVKNLEIADRKDMPICQDTGMAVFFVEVGRDVHFSGDITAAINEGVRRGYKEGYLRNSVVEDPIHRINTGDNTPAIIYYDIVEGDSVKIIFEPKGFGSENMGRLKMLKPADGIEGVKDFIIETVELAGPNPCPPIVIGVGIGGTMDKACQLAKKALARDINISSGKDYVDELEREMLDKINGLDIGPQGLGGKTTALGINIETYPTHIAGLPVAVNINCHVARHIERVI